MAAKNEIKALIIFVDIRGFTAWSEKVDNAAFLDDFVRSWYEILGTIFYKPSRVKPLGDGAMIIQEISGKTSATLLKGILSDALKKIHEAEKSFKELCKKFAEEEGTKIPLVLGWGIAKGPIKKVNKDYIGADINKCFRYCDIARPFGIVIDADDFQDISGLSKDPELNFSKQNRLLKGIHDKNDVWVTREIAEQFIRREELRETPEVHVAGICFKKGKEGISVLLGQRSKSRNLFPGLYEGCGGQLAYDEFFPEGVMRHYRKEYHIEVKVLEENFLLYKIIVNNEPKIPGIRFLCEYLSGTPSSSNHINHTPRWFTEDEFKALPEEQFIQGLKKDITVFFEQFKKVSAHT